MKDSKEKEHRISNLKDMIDNVKVEDMDDIEEDSELITYLNDRDSYEDLEIDDEFIYRPDDDAGYAMNLEEDSIDEEYIINAKSGEEAPKEMEEDFIEDFAGEISDNFDTIMNAKIGRTPVMGMISTFLGLIFIVLAAITYQSRSDRVIDNVISGESRFIAVILGVFGLMLLVYGLYRVIGFRNPLSNISKSIDSVENDEPKDVAKTKEEEHIIPSSNIPLDKESYKIGEFNFNDLKNNLKKPAIFKTKTAPIEENIDDIPPAREKPDERKGFTKQEIEEIEYEQAVLEGESIDDIFAEVEDIDDIPFTIDSEKEKK